MGGINYITDVYETELANARKGVPAPMALLRLDRAELLYSCFRLGELRSRGSTFLCCRLTPILVSGGTLGGGLQMSEIYGRGSNGEGEREIP